MKKKRIIALAAVVIVLAAIIGIYFFVKYQTYTYIETTNTYENNSKDNANYKYCRDGILRYSRDGVALLTDEGEEVWNQPCQMGNPVVEMCGESIAVADKGGTSILVFAKKGLKGEIQTTRPIEKFAVSSQGIVSAILKDEEVPLVMCYDAKGNVLVEHKVSLNSMGYPVDVAISEDGNTLLVSYLNTEGDEIVSHISYYYFGNAETADYQVCQENFKNTVVPVTAFLDKDTSLLVTDRALVLYDGLKKPKESVRITIKSEIQSVAYSDELIAVLVKSDGEAAYQLQVYHVNGKELCAVDVDREYTSMKVIEDKIIMYDGQLCSIFLKNGIHKYEGNTDENILEIFPISGLNKYMMINASGFHEVRLAK